jgi:hypothetical protein
MRVMRNFLKNDIPSLLNKLKKIHPKLSFPKIYEEVVDCESNITAICEKHGEYITFVGNLLYSKSGCIKCRGDTTKKKYLTVDRNHPTVKEMLKYFSLKDPDFKCNKVSPITFICKEHGEFKRSVKILNRSKKFKTSCFKCRSKKDMYTIDYYYNKLKKLHGDKYSYSIDGEYFGAHSRLKITCSNPKHGSWGCSIYNHFYNKTGCPKCAGTISKGSLDLFSYIRSLAPKTESEVKIENLKVDILIRDKKIAIEYLGQYFHSSKFIDKYFHRNRRIFLNSLGYRVIYIWEYEWLTNNSKIKNYFKNVLGFSTPIYARKCSVEKIEAREAKVFIEQNHLMGAGLTCNNYIGLRYNNNLVACAGFRKVFSKKELYRAAYKEGYRVIGGLSKIIKYYVNNYGSSEIIISYVDLDKFEGVSYYKSGFKKDKESLSMFYARRNEIISRHKVKKNILLKINPDLDSNKTEKELCKELKMYQCWNSGTLKVVLNTF